MADSGSDRLEGPDTAPVTGRRTDVAVVVPEDGVAYLKVDNHALDKDALSKFAFEQA